MGNLIKDSLHLNYECESESDYPRLFFFLYIYIYLNYCYRMQVVNCSDFFAPEEHGFQGVLLRLETNLAMNVILSSAYKKS